MPSPIRIPCQSDEKLRYRCPDKSGRIKSASEPQPVRDRDEDAKHEDVAGESDASRTQEKQNASRRLDESDDHEGREAPEASVVRVVKQDANQKDRDEGLPDQKQPNPHAGIH